MKTGGEVKVTKEQTTREEPQTREKERWDRAELGGPQAQVMVALGPRGTAGAAGQGKGVAGQS